MQSKKHQNASGEICAHVESLERRQLLTTLAPTALGNIGLGFRHDYPVQAGSHVYRFTLAVPSTLDASLWGQSSARLTRNGKLMASGPAISRSLLGSGKYELTVNAPGTDVLRLSTASVAASTRVDAAVWGGNAIRLNWDDNSDAETGYRIDRWTKAGWKKAKTAAPGDTAAVIDNLLPGFATSYRVLTRSADGTMARSVNLVTATTEAKGTTGWYRVKLSPFAQGEATWDMYEDNLHIPNDQKGEGQWSKWVQASSWQMAVWSTVRSIDAATQSPKPVKIQAPGHIVEHSFPSGGDFRIGTQAALKTEVDSTSTNPFDITAPPATKMIVVEDSYKSIDRDYDDWQWRVEVSTVADLETDHQNDFGQTRVVETVRTANETDEDAGVGIRLAGPTSDAPGNIFSTPLRVTRPVVPNEIGPGSTVKYFLRRSSGNIQVKGVFESGEFFGSGETIKEIPTTSGEWAEGQFSTTVYMESAGEGTISLVRSENGVATTLDSIKYYSFDTLAVGFSGESFDWGGIPGTDPRQNGMADVTRNIVYKNGNAAYFKESSVDDAIALLHDHIQNHGITKVLLFGHSHGDGQVYKVSDALKNEQYNLIHTVYVDAIDASSNADPGAEVRRPLGALRHSNYYQQNTWHFNGAPTNPVTQGDLSLFVTAQPWGVTLEHQTMDNDPTIIRLVTDRLLGAAGWD